MSKIQIDNNWYCLDEVSYIDNNNLESIRPILPGIVGSCTFECTPEFNQFLSELFSQEDTNG